MLFCVFAVAGKTCAEPAAGSGDVRAELPAAEDPALRRFSDTLAHFIMGTINDDMGQSTEAADEYRQALATGGEMAVIRIKLAADLLLLGDFDAAVKELDEALKVEPDNVRAYLLLALIHVAKGEYDKAQLQYEKALEFEPEDMRILAFLSDLFILRKEFDKAVSIYEKMLRMNPDDPFLHFNLGIIYSRAEQLQKAEESLKKAIEIDKEYLDAQMVLGFVYEVEGNPRGAIKQYETVIDIDPNEEEAYIRAGYLYYRLGEPSKALEKFKALIDLDPYSPEPYLKIFSVYVGLNRFAEAEGILKQAEARGIKEGVIFASFGYLAILEEKFRKAEDYYKQALAKDPGNVFYSFYLGVSIDRLGRRKDAVKIFEKCVASGEPFPEVYNYLGYVYAEEGKKLDRALFLVQKALELDPENPAYMDSLAWVYYKKGDYNKALECIQKAIQGLPDDPVVTEHLGDIYKALGEREKAKGEWIKALELDRNNTKLREKIQKME